jgi:Glycosyltransferase 61
MLLLPVLLLLALYSSHWRGHTGPEQAVIHQVVTESITRTNEGSATTTTVRQEQRSVAHVTSKGGSGLKDWLSGTVNPRTGDAAVGDEDGPSQVISKAVVQVSASGTGLMNKFYFRFDNVQLSRDKITVYYDPDSFTPPTEEHWVDIISGNTTTPQLPTMIVLKGDLHNTQWFYLPVEYLPATEHQPQCASWINPMAYLLQVRYSYNIWHTWNEGLMGIFQTLRELGQLPMASVGPNGKLEEITDGMGEDCAFVYDHLQGKVVPEPKCPPRTGLLERSNCDPKTELWCKPGAVVSARRAGGGPIIVPYTASSVMNVWAHLYSSMTQDIRDWSEVEGSCFRNLVVGKSSTLNFYQAINNTEPDPEALVKFPRIDNLEARVEAMAVFKQFVHSAQKEYIEAEEAKGAAPWEGYRSRALERLRRGVGPEDLVEGVLDGINAREVPGMLREERHELRQRWKMHDRLVERAVQRYMERYGGASEARGAAISEGKQHIDDYEDDYEGVAAQTVKQHEDGLLDGAGESEDEMTVAVAKKIKKTSIRRTLLSSNNVSGASSSSSLSITAKGSKISAAQFLARRSLIDNNAASGALKKWFDKEAVYHHETPRPVVTYMSRNFFSRGVLNEGDILAYILARYNVTLRVTTFEEPLHLVMDSLSTTDVMFGMHGAGWTNGLFIKRGATTMQMFPYGWRLPDRTTLRGFNYREIILASECPYEEWVNPVRENAFFRRSDYSKKSGWNMTYSLHPEPDMPLPQDGWPGNLWIVS